MRSTPPTSAAPDATGQLQISQIGAMALAVSRTVIVLASCVTVAQAQIAIDNTSFSSGDTATLSFSHTVNSASDSLLMVGLAVHAETKVTSVQWGTGSTSCSSTCSPESCLCVLTPVSTITDSGKNVTAQLWRLDNPPANTGNIVITLPSPHRIVSGGTSFVGVDPITPLGTAATNSADTGTPASVSVSSATGMMVLDAIGTSPDTTLATTGARQTEQYQASVHSSAGVSGAGSTAPGAATVTMSWSLASPHWAIIAVPIIPAPTPTAICLGDCDGSSSVTVAEILTLVNMALGNSGRCLSGLAAGVTPDVSVILTAVNNALNGCTDH